MSQASPVKSVIVGAPAPVERLPFSRRTWIIIGIAAALLAVLATILLWRTLKPRGIPPIDAPPIEIIKFAMTSGWDQLPFDRRAMFMKKLDKKTYQDKLKDAYQTGKITVQEHFRAKTLAHFGKHLDRMEKLFALRGKAREDYLDEIARHDLRPPEFRTGKKVQDVEAVIRESAYLRNYPHTWPVEIKHKWDAYWTEVPRKQNELIKQNKKAHRASAATTRPAAVTTKPGIK